MRIGLTAGCLLLFGCGTADQTRAVRGEEGGAESSSIDVNPKINLCPHFASTFLSPQAVPVGSSAFISVRAVDPDSSAAELVYRWSAAAGSFTSPTEPTTEYLCAEVGEQTLTLVATDAASCDARLHLDVTCLNQ